jgi:hypothetical protein
VSTYVDEQNSSEHDSNPRERYFASNEDDGPGNHQAKWFCVGG